MSGDTGATWGYAVARHSTGFDREARVRPEGYAPRGRWWWCRESPLHPYLCRLHLVRRSGTYLSQIGKSGANRRAKPKHRGPPKWAEKGKSFLGFPACGWRRRQCHCSTVSLAATGNGHNSQKLVREARSIAPITGHDKATTNRPVCIDTGDTF